MLDIDIAIGGPIGYRQFILDKICNSHEGHTHNYDHTTFIHRGRVKVIYSYEQNGKKIEGESREYNAGEFIPIKANVYHTIKALEDNTIYYCIYSHRDFDGQISQKYIGNEGAYA